MEIRRYRTFYGVLREMTLWLVEQGVTHVAMEASGIYTMPVFHALMEFGSFEQVLVCNAAHVKNVPDRKTDASDAAWLAELLEVGLLRGAFILPEQVKTLQDLVCYRAKLVEQWAAAREFSRDARATLRSAPLGEWVYRGQV
jgi:transposase